MPQLLCKISNIHQQTTTTTVTTVSKRFGAFSSSPCPIVPGKSLVPTVPFSSHDFQCLSQKSCPNCPNHPKTNHPIPIARFPNVSAKSAVPTVPIIPTWQYLLPESCSNCHKTNRYILISRPQTSPAKVLSQPSQNESSHSHLPLPNLSRKTLLSTVPTVTIRTLFHFPHFVFLSLSKTLIYSCVYRYAELQYILTSLDKRVYAGYIHVFHPFQWFLYIYHIYHI